MISRFEMSDIQWLGIVMAEVFVILDLPTLIKMPVPEMPLFELESFINQVLKEAAKGVCGFRAHPWVELSKI